MPPPLAGRSARGAVEAALADAPRVESATIPQETYKGCHREQDRHPGRDSPGAGHDQGSRRGARAAGSVIPPLLPAVRRVRTMAAAVAPDSRGLSRWPRCQRPRPQASA